MAVATTARPTRRDMLEIATGAAALVGLGAVAWPLIDQMNPDASTLALATTDVDISKIPVGQIVTVKWRGKPVFIDHRTPKEIDEARAVAAERTARSGDRPVARAKARMAGRHRRLHASRLRAGRP